MNRNELDKGKRNGRHEVNADLQLIAWFPHRHHDNGGERKLLKNHVKTLDRCRHLHLRYRQDDCTQDSHPHFFMLLHFLTSL